MKYTSITARRHEVDGQFELLESRTLLAAIIASESLLDQFGVTSTSSSQSILAPLAQRSFTSDDSSTISANASAYRSLISLDKFASDSRFGAITGRGFSSVILDTGIDLDHAFFGPDADKNGVADRIVYQYDFADNDADASDRSGHGSNVSSIVASSDGAFPGVAPESNIIALKVFGDNGSGSFSVIERALQWVIANASKYNIASVNLSLGDGANFMRSTQRYGIGDELAALAAQRVIVVAAAGNSFYEYAGEQGVSYPAADPSVIAAGAVYASGSNGFSYGSGAKADSTAPDRLTPFSQRSTTIQTIFAPGAPMTGANQSGGTVTMHGTSQASPVLAGVATLAQQLATSILNRRLSLAEFRTVLDSSGASIVDGDDEQDNALNTGSTFKRVDVLALGNAIINLVPQTSEGDITGGSAAPVRPNRAPTLSNVRTLVGAQSGRAATISYELLAAAANEMDADGNAISFRLSAISAKGTLAKNGVPVVAGVTLAAGESLVFTPAANYKGTLNAFSIVATDGQLSSKKAIAVAIKVTKPASSVSAVPLMPKSVDAVAPATRAAAAPSIDFAASGSFAQTHGSPVLASSDPLAPFAALSASGPLLRAS